MNNLHTASPAPDSGQTLAGGVSLSPDRCTYSESTAMYRGVNCQSLGLRETNMLNGNSRRKCVMKTLFSNKQQMIHLKLTNQSERAPVTYSSWRICASRYFTTQRIKLIIQHLFFLSALSQRQIFTVWWMRCFRVSADQQTEPPHCQHRWFTDGLLIREGFLHSKPSWS